MNSDLDCSDNQVRDSNQVALIVPKQYVKTVKTALERHGKLDHTVKILPELQAGIDSIEGPRDEAKEQGISKGQTHHVSPSKMRIATTIPYRPSDKATDRYHKALVLEIMNDLDIPHISDDISISHHKPQTNGIPTPPKNPLHKAIHAALSTLPDSIFTTSNVTRDALILSFPDGYSIYPPLLLFPPNALTSPPWTTLLATHGQASSILQLLWSSLASAMNVTHIALNSPIPLLQSSLPSANILRSPLNITPLFGDFGTTPTEENKQHPSQQDFDTALWIGATQNGIHQVWAPLYTMFSRGNIREKTRVLGFAGQSGTSTSASSSPVGREKAAVVDMYAGIGYFAFSYRATSFRPIFCFELNPWSVEGLRRGAEKNGWLCRIYTEHDITDGNVDVSGDDVDFHIFQTSNEHARSILATHQTTIPPIRHVNLGLLPHSRDSWRDAAALVDREMGGWIHAHENVGVGEMEERKGEIERIFQGYLDEEGSGRKVRVEHVERVKMYAPGVVHCVFDVSIESRV